MVRLKISDITPGTTERVFALVTCANETHTCKWAFAAAVCSGVFFVLFFSNAQKEAERTHQMAIVWRRLDDARRKRHGV